MITTDGIVRERNHPSHNFLHALAYILLICWLMGTLCVALSALRAAQQDKLIVQASVITIVVASFSIGGFVSSIVWLRMSEHIKRRGKLVILLAVVFFSWMMFCSSIVGLVIWSAMDVPSGSKSKVLAEALFAMSVVASVGVIPIYCALIHRSKKKIRTRPMQV